jgi:hypothetical protein
MDTELFNEFTLYVLCCHLHGQTRSDPVSTVSILSLSQGLLTLQQTALPQGRAFSRIEVLVL